MSVDYTTTELINLINLNISVPNIQQRYTDGDLITFLNQEMNNNIVPEIKKENQEYFVVPFDFNLTANVAAYTMPSACIGETLRLVTQLWPTTGPNTLQRESQIRRLSQEEISAFWNGQPLTYNDNFYGFYPEGNNIIFYPPPQNNLTNTIRLRYFRQPNNLVSTNDCGQIVSIDTVTNTLTLDNIPVDWAVGTKICSIANKPPFINEIESTPILTLAPPDIIIDDVTGLEVGDWICLEGDSPIPQLPYSAFGCLVQATIVKICQGIGDTQGMQIAQGVLEKLYPQMLATINPRISGQPRKRVTNGNGIFDYNRRSAWRTWT